MYLCVQIFIYVCAYILTCVYLGAYTYMYMCIYTHICVYIIVYVYARESKLTYFKVMCLKEWKKRLL